MKKGQEFAIFVGGPGTGFGTANGGGGGLVAVFDRFWQKDLAALTVSDLAAGKEFCLVVAGSGGAGGDDGGTFEDREGGSAGLKGYPGRNSAPQGNQHCKNNFATQTSGAGWFKGGGNRGGAGWQGGNTCESSKMGAGAGSSYIRGDLLNPMFGEKGSGAGSGEAGKVIISHRRRLA